MSVPLYKTTMAARASRIVSVNTSPGVIWHVESP